MKNRVKKGNYTYHNEKEYKIARNSINDTFELVSYDKEDLQHGFTDISKRFKGVVPFILAKTIDLSEISEVYSVYTYAIYQGYEVSIESFTDSTVLLATNDKMFYEKYGFKEVDRNLYMKDVPFDEVELVDRREPARYIESAKTFV